MDFKPGTRYRGHSGRDFGPLQLIRVQYAGRYLDGTLVFLYAPVESMPTASQ